MATVKPRRLDYVAQTRLALLDAAEEAFVREGYGATSIDRIAAAARFTKGAVYRHFADKRALFLAVFERVETDAVDELAASMEASEDAWRDAVGVLAEFLRLCLRQRYRRVVLEEAPTVLGWARWRELDQEFTGDLLRGVLERLVEAGEIEAQPVEPLARLCCAVIGEAALVIVASDDPDAARAQLLATLSRMFAGLRADGVEREEGRA